MPIQRINGKTSPYVRKGWFLCAICEEPHDRRSNSQKYCDGCRRIAVSRKMAEYYRKHRKEILKQKAVYREENREMLRIKMRQYQLETKGERLTRAEEAQ